jgi:hypothetical protein
MSQDSTLTRLVFFVRTFTAPNQGHFEGIGTLDLLPPKL